MAKKTRAIYDGISESDIINNIGGIKGNEPKYYFATRLNRLLKDKNIPQQKLSDEADVSDGALSSYRRGKSEPGITNLCRIAKHLKVSTDYLLGKAKIPSTKEDIKLIAEHTGLTEDAITTLKRWNKKPHAFKSLTLLIDTIINSGRLLLDLENYFEYNREVISLGEYIHEKDNAKIFIRDHLNRVGLDKRNVSLSPDYFETILLELIKDSLKQTKSDSAPAFKQLYNDMVENKTETADK